jgi:hypothetical protein
MAIPVVQYRRDRSISDDGRTPIAKSGGTLQRTGIVPSGSLSVGIELESIQFVVIESGRRISSYGLARQRNRPTICERLRAAHPIRLGNRVGCIVLCRDIYLIDGRSIACRGVVRLNGAARGKVTVGIGGSIGGYDLTIGRYEVVPSGNRYRVHGDGWTSLSWRNKTTFRCGEIGQ